MRLVRCTQSHPQLAAAVLMAATISPQAWPIEISISPPTFDQWNYPFAGNTGGSTYASVFGSYTEGSGFHPDFDNRDGQMTLGFNTVAAGVTAGLGQWRYTIASATVSLMVENSNAFQYDPTPDSYRIWLPANDPQFQVDSDAGHPVELFGTWFRNGFTLSSYNESSAYSPLGSFGKGIRSAFPMAWTGNSFSDVSNNVDMRFDPTAFAVGTISTLAPGDFVPSGAVMRFELNVNDPNVQNYLRRSLHQGMVDFVVASVFAAEQQQTGTYPRFYTKENIAVAAGLASAARLTMSVTIAPAEARAGDVNGDGVVNVSDLLSVIGAWGPCPVCPADVTYDGVVNVSDLLTVISTWGS